MTDIPTNSWQEDSPTGDDFGYNMDNKIRFWLTQVREILGRSHKHESSGQGADWGKHQDLYFTVQGSPVTVGANKGTIYVKDIDSKAELCWEDEDENEHQMISKGAIHLPTATPSSLVNGMVWGDTSGADSYIKYRRSSSTESCTLLSSSEDVPTTQPNLAVVLGGSTYYNWLVSPSSDVATNLYVYAEGSVWALSNLSLSENEVKNIDSDLVIVGTGSGNFLVFPRGTIADGVDYLSHYDSWDSNWENATVGVYPTWDSNNREYTIPERNSDFELFNFANNCSYKGFHDWKLPSRTEALKLEYFYDNVSWDDFWGEGIKRLWTEEESSQRYAYIVEMTTPPYEGAEGKRSSSEDIGVVCRTGSIA